MENKALTQAKDAVAKKYGYGSWDIFRMYKIITNEILDEVATTYADSQWVDVKERMPEVNSEYLLYCYQTDMEQYFNTVGYFEKEIGGFNTDMYMEDDFILFWMPLPKAPKK